MARKRLIRTHDLPYHLYGRSNNKEWFYLPLDEVWRIFSRHLRQATDEYGLLIHAFVLMSNHYHMVASSTFRPIDEVMCRLLKGVSDEINYRAGRINHVFGGPYKWTLLKNWFQYQHVVRYVYQNPVRAGMTRSTRSYPFSSLHSVIPGKQAAIPVTSHRFDRFSLTSGDWFQWVDETYDDEHRGALRRALFRREFEFCRGGLFRRIPPQFSLEGAIQPLGRGSAESDGAPFVRGCRK